MIAIGVDVHKRQCTVAIQREDGELGCFGPMENTREGWRELLEQLPPEAESALEVSTSGYFAMSVLEEAGWLDRAHWVHTAGIDKFKKAEIRPAGREAAGAQAVGGGSGSVAGGVVSASGDSAAPVAGAPAVLAGGVANPGQESVAEFAADARATSNGDGRVRSGGASLAGGSNLAGSDAGKCGAVAAGCTTS